MKLMLDLNVLLDVVQRRDSFYFASATVLSKVVEAEQTGFLPGHAVTTLHYIVRKSAGKAKADEFIDWLLAHFEIVPQDKLQFTRARTLLMPDFEDAALAAAAEAAGCDMVLSRNVADFVGSPVRVMTPEEFLVQT
ncbi:MAG TPA: PIN domain-containing protein [Thermoanaerobaculia bacterium]|nr:PIN domain-containing protein [Thermoanaerobaculia bacterium]